MADKEISSVVQDSFENNKWMNVKGWEIPINIEPPIELLQSLLETINGLLDFTLFVLDFIKAFIRNFLNPLLSIVKKIIALLKAILLDLRQVGFYFTSDIPLFEKPDQLLGGYPAFERRMLARLTNDADPNRPNISSQSAVFGMYLYGDSNFGDISQILRLIQQMMKLFGRDVKAPPPPSITNVSAINVKVRDSILDLSEGEDAIELKWQVAGNNGGLFNNEIGGFLIEVSTELDGFYLAYDSIVENATFSTDKGGKRQRGLVSDDRYKSNVRIFGGSVWLHTLKGLFYEEGKTKPFELKLVKNPNSNVTISPSKLEEGKTQRTYFVPVFDFSMDNTKEFSVKIKYADLPEGYDIETETDVPREKVAIRIRTLDVASRELIIENTSGITRDFVGEPKYYYDLNLYLTVNPSKNVKTGVKAKLHYSEPINDLRYSPPSDPTVINVSVIKEEFRQICFWAVASSILRGYDITESNKAIANMMPTVNVNVMRSSSSKAYKNADNFGLRLYRDINTALDKAFDRVRCSDTLQDAIIEAYNGLTNVDGVEYFFGDDGLFVFPELGLFEKKDRKIDRLFGNTTKMMQKAVKGRAPRLLQLDKIAVLLAGVGSEKSFDTPCYYESILENYGEVMKIKHDFPLLRGLRNWATAPNTDLLDEDGIALNIKIKASVEEEALILTLLNLLFGSQNLDRASDWSCFRLFPEGIPFLEDIINKAINFMENVKETLEGFGKKILKAIAAIEDKINRIQQIIAFIDRILELLKGLSLDITVPLYALAHVADGTDGLVAKLLSSQLKPAYSEPTVDTDGEIFGWNPEETHAAGMLVVAGGLGMVELFEFLIKLLVSEEETPDTIIIAEEEE